MQKWEYVFLECVWYDSIWKPYRLNGRELPNWKKDPATLATLAQQMGNDGWELVSGSVAGANSTNYELIFKRPKP